MYTNKEIWNVSYPIFLGLLAQNIINVTDTAFLGRVGEVELGASAMGGLFYICVFTIAFGFSIGSQILIARRNGEGRYKDVGPVVIQGGTFLLKKDCKIITLYVSSTTKSRSAKTTQRWEMRVTCLHWTSLPDIPETWTILKPRRVLPEK